MYGVEYVTSSSLTTHIDRIITQYLRNTYTWFQASAALQVHLRSSGTLRKVFLDFLTLEDGTDRISETSIWNYRSTLRNIT